MTKVCNIQTATEKLQQEITQLLYDLDLAEANGNAGEIKRIQEAIKIRNDSLKKWIHLQRVFDEIWGEENADEA